jgi:superfamily II DNA or RNA helicase
MPAAVPDQGQLVEVRQRHFVVLEVADSGLPTDGGLEGVRRKQHLVTLSSVEDDALGEELQVVWELEPGVHIYEKMNLPNPVGFDDPVMLDCFLDAVRWGSVVSADSRAIQSPFRSGIDIEDYQLDPVVRAIQMPRVNLLVADDTGSGKTVEAGLVLQELIIRNRARSVVIACPASLQIQWRDQMRDKFGLDFRIIDSELFKDLRRRRGIHVNPWQHFPRLITSIDFMKRERPLRLFRELLPADGEPTYPRRFDLLIVDEAHNIAPSGNGRYATDSQRTAAIRMLSRHFEHKLFLSATPHNGYQESFTALLELLDNQRFHRGVPPDPKQLGAVMVRRLKSELPPRWDGSPRFAVRKLEAVEVPYTPEERRAHKVLQEYTASRLSRARTHDEEFAAKFVLKLLKKRLFSSPAAFESTLAKHVQSLRDAKVRNARIQTPTVKILQKQIDQVDEEYADDDAYEESTAEALDSASKLFADLNATESGLLSELQRYGDKASRRADTKARTLLDWLHKTLKPGGAWTDNRVLIFTEYRTTQKWLQTLLAAEGFTANGRLEVLYGGMPTDQRERVKAAFQTHPAVAPVRILLATDAASEGIDLQNHCYRLVHYEIPWNPNRLEQRNGRLDRHGQKAPEVLVHHFVAEGYDKQAVDPKCPPGDLDGDLEFLMRAAQKVNTIREDLGKVGPVIAQQVEDAMLGRRKSLDTSQAEADAKPVRQLLKMERDIREQIEKLHEQLHETKRELHISPENILRSVEIGLTIAGQPPLQKTTVTSRDGKKVEAYILPPMTGSWNACHIGLAHPHTGEMRPVVFDHSLANGRDDVVLAHLNHRLVQMCLRLLRAEIWSSGERKRLHRVAVRLVEDKDLDHVVVVAHGRLVVLGGDNHRIHEELISAGGRLREGRFARLNVSETNVALEAGLPDEAPDAMKKRILEIWPNHWDALMSALEARMKDRTENLESILSRRTEREVEDMTQVLLELERNIKAELKDYDRPEQLVFTGWSTTEQEQFRRNVDSIRVRLEQIPDEIVRETAAIRKRYAKPSPRLFPVAVTYLVPRKIARETEGRA